MPGAGGVLFPWSHLQIRIRHFPEDPPARPRNFPPVKPVTKGPPGEAPAALEYLQEDQYRIHL